MELDELQDTWNELGKQTAAKPLSAPAGITSTHKSILRSRLYRILLPEIAGGIVCLLSILYILLHFDRLDSTGFRFTGILTILLLGAMCLLSLCSLQYLYKSEDLNRPYAETLRAFSYQKSRFCRLQKINLFLGYGLLASSILLSTRIFGRNPVTDNKYFFLITYLTGYYFLFFFSRKVFSGYQKTIRETETLLQELSAG